MEWISVAERLPKEADMGSKPADKGWIITDCVKVWVTYSHPSYWNRSDPVFDSNERCTHWLPMPEPPAREEA